MTIDDEYRVQLQKLCYTTGENKIFVPRDTLLDFWEGDTLEKFFATKRLELGIECKQCPLAGGVHKERYSSAYELISILIWVSYPAWHHFHDVYCPKYQNNLDDMALFWTLRLPDDELFDDTNEEQAEILWNDKLSSSEDNCGSGAAKLSTFITDFLEAQYIFTPLCFKEGQLDEHGGKKPTVPLLWSREEVRGRGAAGTVIEALIPEHSFETIKNHKKYIAECKAPGNPDGPSSRFHRVACKRINPRGEASVAMGKQELKNLNLLSRRRLQHSNISRAMAAASTSDPHQIFILFDLAICDLESLLQKQSAPGIDHIIGRHLFDQMFWLSDALLFIHESLGRHVDATDNNLAFCHLDIKPANILIYEYEGFPVNERLGSNVGTWKLTDFGIAGENQLRAISKRGHTTWTLTDSLHMRGMFSAPEHFHDMPIGRAADVWSLGCVMFLVTLLGYDAEALRQLYGEDGVLMGRSTNDTSDAPDGRFYRESEESEHPLSGKRNPHVSAWLDRFEYQRQGELDEPLFDLVRDMLCVDPGKRLKISDVLTRLHPILKALRQQDLNNEYERKGVQELIRR